MTNAQAGKVAGTVKDSTGNIIPYATLQIKGSSIGTTANNDGRFYLNLEPGNYTLVCQHVNFKRDEKKITVTDDTLAVDFQLLPQKYVMQEVIIKRGEDPAYEIIRNAIAKRKEYQDELDRYTCQVYTKGMMKMRSIPKKFMGIKVEQGNMDSMQNQIIYLSETFARYAVDGRKSKIEVTATKVSGESQGFGLSAPQVFSFYNNNIQIGANLNPRGFISPISENALNYYKYKYEGAFFEEGLQVSRIRVIPRRRFEPLFSGYINIVENTWRIHSVQLVLTKESQMQIVDSLTIEQLYIPLENKFVMQTQVIYPVIKLMGLDLGGSFVNIYSDYNLQPSYAKNFFDETIIRYADSSNKKDAEFWAESRPVVLQQEELNDYRRKDSIELAQREPGYLDSLDRMANKVGVLDLIMVGKVFGKSKSGTTIYIPPAIQTLSYNTVEGPVMQFSPVLTRRLDTSELGIRGYSITPSIRYGFHNTHLNASVLARYTYGRHLSNAITLNGGRQVFQFNNESPIRPFENTVSTLLFGKNYMKIYEAWFGSVTWNKGISQGLNVVGSLQYQDRSPLENSSIGFRKEQASGFTPNYPAELMPSNLQRHQALSIAFGIQWQPGTKYVEFPERKVRLGSRYPLLALKYTRGIGGLMGSDVDYSRWAGEVRDQLNLKLAGSFKYRAEIGGFISKNRVEVPDYIHFNGNQYIFAGAYLNSFQLAPYYKYSNTENFYFKGHAEHHFNGFLTNKIPLFRRLNWNLVAGTNAFYVNRENSYVEVFAGLENIMKIIRVDFINAYEHGHSLRTGVRIGIDASFLKR
jgi:hypothetical protein